MLRYSVYIFTQFSLHYFVLFLLFGQCFLNSHTNWHVQRERKQRKAYSDYLIDDDHEGARGFSVAEKLESSKFAQVDMVREMKGHDLTIS